MEFQFKIQNPDKEKRKEQCKSLLIKEPDKVPIILEKDPLCHLEGIKKTRHLIKRDFTINKFLQIIKKLMKLPQEEALFLAAKGKYNLVGERSIDEIYNTYKDKEDGFLYIMYSSVLVYG
jgi:hypothetical protein